MRRATSFVAACAALTATAPAAFAAPTIATDRRCYSEGQPVRLSGAGFGAGENVALSGASTLRGPSAADGTFAASFNAPATGTSGPGTRTRKVTAKAESGAASTTFRIARVGADFTPNQARARSTVRWKLAGFPSTKTVYAHYVLGGKQRRTVRFGRPSGSCGELSKRVRLIPTRARSGTWTVQLDNRKTYSKRKGWLVRKKIIVFLRPVLSR